MTGDEIPIEDLQGLKRTYKPDFYYNYPFSENDIFNHTDCICIAVTRFKNKWTNMDLIGYLIEFKEEVNNKTYADKLDINFFQCLGLAVIDSNKKDSISVIEDLKSNSNFYVEKAGDLY